MRGLFNNVLRLFTASCGDTMPVGVRLSVPRNEFAEAALESAHRLSLVPSLVTQRFQRVVQGHAGWALQLELGQENRFELTFLNLVDFQSRNTVELSTGFRILLAGFVGKLEQQPFEPVVDWLG